MPDAIKYLLSKTQQNGVLCFEKITFDEDSPDYKYDIKTMGSIHQLRKSGIFIFFFGEDSLDLAVRCFGNNALTFIS